MALVQTTVPWDHEARRAFADPAFPVAEYEARVARLRAEMERAGLTHLLAYSNFADPGNVRWLAGFNTSYGDSLVVVAPDAEPLLVTNWVLHDEPMHAGIYQSWLRDTRVVPRGDAGLVAEVAGYVRQHGGGGGARIGLAGRRVAPAWVVAGLSRALEADDFADGDTPLLAARRCKSPLEVATMRRAARITGAGLAAAMAACVPG